MRGHSQLVKVLAAHGADFEARDRTGFLPLHYAAQYGHVEVRVRVIEIDREREREIQYGHVEVRESDRDR